MVNSDNHREPLPRVAHPIDRFFILSESWRIIGQHSDPRSSARALCHLLAEVLNASIVGLEFHDIEGYIWREQVEQIGVNTTVGHWTSTFPDGKSYWFFNGGKSHIPIFESVLNLLTDQWIQCMQQVRTTKRKNLKEPDFLTYNPAWIAVSPPSYHVLSRLPDLCLSSRPLLLIGESGSGKSYLARLIHKNGAHPFESFSTPSMKNSERNGTLFIPAWEKISDEDREIFLGDKRRIIAAMPPVNDAEDIIRNWKLLTRSSGQTMNVPSLQDRLKDLPLLACHFLEMAASALGRIVPGISRMALGVLKTYDWPGNTRELKETMARSLEKVPVHSPLLEVENLPATIRGVAYEPQKRTFSKRISMMEYDVLKEELRLFNGNITHTARAMGFTPRQVSWRLKKYGIEPRSFNPEFNAMNA